MIGFTHYGGQRSGKTTAMEQSLKGRICKVAGTAAPHMTIVKADLRLRLITVQWMWNNRLREMTVPMAKIAILLE